MVFIGPAASVASVITVVTDGVGDIAGAAGVVAVVGGGFVVVGDAAIAVVISSTELCEVYCLGNCVEGKATKQKDVVSE